MFAGRILQPHVCAGIGGSGESTLGDCFRQPQRVPVRGRWGGISEQAHFRSNWRRPLAKRHIFNVELTVVCWHWCVTTTGMGSIGTQNIQGPNVGPLGFDQVRVRIRNSPYTPMWSNPSQGHGTSCEYLTSRLSHRICC